MRRSISLSPIRTESGANLRTANWTRLKFRNPNQQHRNYNHGNYQNYNNRGYHHHNQRYNNRGRGYYRNQNFTTTRYIPKRRYPNRRDDSRSRSRSYSRSISRDRSGSRSRYSRSRSRSSDGERSHSRDREMSRSFSPPPKKVERRASANVKTEASTYYRAQSPKNDVEFPEKVAEGLSPWHSSSGYNTMFQSSANKKMQEALSKSADAEEVQEKMKKTALESIARHEKSLHKIKLEQSKKIDTDSEQSDDDYEVIALKKKKKAKKKKAKVTKPSKKKQKVQKVKIEVSDSDSSSSDSSEDKSSDSDSSSSSPPPAKKSKSVKKKKSSAKEEGSTAKPPVQQPAAFFPFGQGSVPQGASQPVMMMAPNMASGDMKFVGPYGQPMNVIKFEMPGPDGKMMQFLQIPSMPQGAMQPVMMAPPVTTVQKQQPQQVAPQPVPQPVPVPQTQQPVPQPVAAPATTEAPQKPTMASNLKVVPIQEDSTELSKTEPSSQDTQDLSEKQKRRKEVIRTRLWPRPATSNWSPNDNEDQEEEKPEESQVRSGDHIPGLSPSYAPNKSESSEVQGQKIPTVGGATASTNFASAAVENSQDSKDEVIEEEVLVESFDEELITTAPTTTTTVNPSGLVAYPQLVQGFTPVFSNPVAASTQRQESQSSVTGSQGAHQWSAAADEFLRNQEKFIPSSDGEVSSSSDEEEKLVKLRQRNEAKRALKLKAMKEEESKKQKKKKKNKKERKLSVMSDEPTTPVKEKKRKKKKKAKDKTESDGSELESKIMKVTGDRMRIEQADSKRKKKDDLDREIPHEMTLSHLRGLINRKPGEGSRSIFVHVDFTKLKKSKSLREAHDTYEDQFVSLFHEETEEPVESPLNMSRSALKKLKIRSQGIRAVSHMTKISLCERIAIRTGMKKFDPEKSTSQKVSMNLASLSSVEKKFDKPKERSASRSPSKSSRSPSKSPSRSRSSKSLSKSRSPRRYRSRSASRSSYSSRSRSRSKSLPKAYTVDDGRRSHDEEKRVYRRDDNRYQNRNYQQQHHQQYRNNPNYRYQNRGRGYYNNYNNRGNRGNYYNNRGNYNNRGYYNRNRGYYNNNNNRQQWRPNYNRDRRDSDRGDRSFERRSYTRSPERRRASSYSSDGSDRRERSIDRNDYNKQDMKETKDARNLIERKQGKKSPIHWTHDKYEEGNGPEN